MEIALQNIEQKYRIDHLTLHTQDNNQAYYGKSSLLYSTISSLFYIMVG